mgnify:CR=1 FL=1
MAIEETIYSVLSAAAGVTALVPVSRIKPPGDWQYMTRPYIIYRPITFNPTHIHNSVTVNLINHYPNLQINIVADSYSSARAVADAVTAAIRGTANGLQSGWQFFLRNELPLEWDGDRKIMEIAQDYEVFGA